MNYLVWSGNQKFAYIDGELIPLIVEKPVKSLGRWYNSSQHNMLRDQGHVEELRQFIAKAINTIGRTFLPGKLDWWCLRWPLTVYEVTISAVKKFESIVNKAINQSINQSIDHQSYIALL